MHLTTENKITHNWFLHQQVVKTLEQHDSQGSLSDNRVYLGDTRRITEAVNLFKQSAASGDVESVRLYARLSCRNNTSKKYHVVALYQTERHKGGVKKQVIEVTWAPRGRTPLTQVVNTIGHAFSELTQSDPKYGQKALEIVGSLREFEPGRNHPFHRVK